MQEEIKKHLENMPLINGLQDILYFLVDIMILFLHILVDMKDYILNFFYAPPMDYKNKTAFITGANGGVGRQLCINLAKKGCNLICLEHPDCKQAMEYFRESTLTYLNPNINVLVYYIDLSNLESVEEFAETILSNHELHFSIFNAAITYHEEYINAETEKSLKVLRVNLMSNMILLKHITRQMIKNKCGDIVAISSVLSEHGVGTEFAYSASKAAVSSLLESAALYCAMKKHDYIRFHTIYPAKINTQLFSHFDLSKYGNYILPPMQPEYVATKTIDAISFNYRDVFLPGFSIKFFIFARQVIPPKSLYRAFQFCYSLEDSPPNSEKKQQ